MTGLRDYQEECLKTVVERYRAGVRRQLVVLPTGAGKCVAWDTMLVTSSGIVPAWEARRLPRLVADHEGGAREPAAWIDDGVRDTVTIFTHLGTHITATPRHPLLAVDHDSGDPRWVQAGQIRPGDLLAVQPPCPQVLPRHEAVLGSGKHRIAVTADLAWILGVTCASNAAVTQHAILVLTRDLDAAEELRTACRSSGLPCMVSSYPGGPLVRVSAPGLVAALTSEWQWFPRREAAGMPPCVLRSGARVQASFVRGVAWVSGTPFPEVRSRRLCLDMQLVLINLGCVTRVVRRGRGWTLVPETHEDEALIRDLLAGRDPSQTRHLTPGLESHCGYRVARVTQVRRSSSRVCDLHVPDTNSYVGNGLVCHNTVVAAHLPPRLGWPRTLFVVHREELIQQAASTFRSAWPTVSVGIERGPQRSSGEQVVVASIQSVSREPRLSALAAQGWGLVVIDEAHHAVASTYRRLLRRIGTADPGWSGLLLGITATSRRGDGVGLWSVFDEVSYSKTILEMVEAGYLVSMRGYLVRSGTSLAGVRVRMGDFDERQLAAAVNTPDRNRLVVGAYGSLARGRKAAVFCVDVAHAVALADAFREAGFRAAPVYGAMAPEQRAAVLQAFRAGDLDVVTNVGILTEGYDDPGIDCVVMARPTCSGLLYTQIVGRGVRPAPGKRDCVVIDILDLSRAHARHLVTLPTLFGLPPGFDLKGKPADEVVKEYRTAAKVFSDAGVPEEVSSQVLTPEDIRALVVEVDLLKYALVPPAVSAASDLVWQRMPDDSYVTSAGDDWEVVVRQNVMGRWEVLSASRSCGTTKHGECLTLTDAVRLGTRVVKDTYPEAVPLLYKAARWRQDPATDRQLALLRKLGVTPPPGLTKGQAQLLIQRHTRG